MAIDLNVAAAINAGENEYRQKVLGQGPLPGHAELQPIPVVAPEPAAVRIVKALAALVAALPGAKLVTVHTDGAVSIDCENDEGVRAMADALGTRTREVNFDGYRWLSADRHVAPRVYVHGPHHAIDLAPLDESAVTAALAQAEAAL